MTDMIGKIEDDTTRAFAVACYDMNTIEELTNVEPDEIDMKQWGITADQWREAVEAARTDLISKQDG
ncbi:hypothetical protein [Marinobacter sp. X15-166B]|uniref:hypothetical protein n=1 Tax=Marinobacter sp. X15-166B TaxID=1897620 RepID=UPI00085C3CDA|nr:hypothetical protein [Marinobacter sp. X15-166B]OEY66788.1 hypothetical protein BG841_10205 [Marinobacter sp. X15-166B]